VIQLLDRHNRDSAAIAERLQVPHLVAPDEIPNSPFQCIPVKRMKRWAETALWWPETRTLVVAEAVGTNASYTGGKGRVGVHLLLRLTPPKVLASFEPARLLVGHGEGVHGTAVTTGLGQALAHSRRGLPRYSYAFLSPVARSQERAPASKPGRTRRGGATRPASFTGGLSGSASGSAPKDACTRSSEGSP
jgi:hypothetical protein